LISLIFGPGDWRPHRQVFNYPPVKGMSGEGVNDTGRPDLLVFYS
jgi:hypothetical protein